MLRNKAKQPTPQELYRARKQREEEERDANLPPGLINHGNTCFMNSTLQGLIATPQLHSLVNFELIPGADPRRSPQLTNGHGGQYQHEWVQGMPLGDVFVTMLQKAWNIQASHRRETMSPKELLTTIGQKYDQYLDFRQQDAHEFLRHMLDAMRMEELDAIKKRQPSLPKGERRQSQKGAVDRPERLSTDSSLPNGQAKEEKLQSFVDMLFGGKLASILVCGTCKKISVTYEDFNDLSLSIKPEDYMKERKRDRFKLLAKKFRFRPKELSSNSSEKGLRFQRSSSVPASPIRRSMEPQTNGAEPPVNVDHRRRSFDHATLGGTEEEARDSLPELTPLKDAHEPETASASMTSVDEATHAESAHVSFVDSSAEPEKRGKDDAWGRLGRRISMTMGMTRRDKRPGRSRERGGKLRDSRAPSEERPGTGTTTPRIPIPISYSLNDAIDSLAASRTNSRAQSPAPGLNISSSFPNMRRHSASIIGEKKAKAHQDRPPKPTREESEYLRRVLADVHSSSHSTFSMLHQALSGGASQSTPTLSAQALLARLGHLPGIEECLRLFTAVEVLDGENMVGCHRCWKMANGTYKPRHQAEEDGSEGSDEGTQDDPIIPSGEDVALPEMLRRTTSDSADIPDYVSPASEPMLSTTSADDSSSLLLQDTASVMSMPTTVQSDTPKPPPPPLAVEVVRPPTPPVVITPKVPLASYGGLPIPSISTTAPDTPSPVPASTPEINPAELVQTSVQSKHTLLLPPENKRKTSRRGSDADESGVSSDDEGYDSASSAEGSIYSDASSVASPSASPSASPRASVEKLPLSAQSSRSSDGGRGSTTSKVPRSERVILRQTYKRYLIATPPPILVIHLKRFQQISKSNPYAMAFSGGFKKLDDFVAFPEHLDLAPFLAPKKEDYGLGNTPRRRKHKEKHANKEKDAECMYRLYAVVVHIGNMLGGHYIAYTALPPSSVPRPPSPDEHSSEKEESGLPKRQWAYISDTVVRLTTIEEVLKAKAYICMYERVY